MQEKTLNTLFDELREVIMPICVDYGRSIIKEALLLPLMEPSLWRINMRFTPIVEKTRDHILSDERFTKAINYFLKIEFFEKFKEKTLLLDLYIFKVSPINIILMLLEYVIYNHEGSLVRFREQINTWKEVLSINQIDEQNKKSITFAMELLENLISSSSAVYLVDSTLYGLRGKFNSIQFGEYTLTTIDVPLAIADEVKPVNVSLINIRKRIIVNLDTLIFNSEEEAMQSNVLTFLWYDPALEFAELVGFLTMFIHNVILSLHTPNDYVGNFFGSRGTHIIKIPSNSASPDRGDYIGMAYTSFRSGMPELSQKDLIMLNKYWIDYLDDHVKSRDNVGTALRRLGMSSIHRSPEDRLIDLFIGLESLIGIDSKEQSTKKVIGKRMQMLIKEREDTYETVLQAYGVRNKLLHSGRKDIKDRDLERINSKLSQLLGMGIIRYISLCEKNNFTNESSLVKHLDTLYKETQIQKTHKTA